MPQEGTAQLVQNLPRFHDPNLVVGTEGFSDAGVYRLRDDLLIVQSLDFFPPLVDDPFVYGQIAAANSLSDLYAMGAQPTTALNIVGFPDKELDLSILAEILRGGSERVLQAGAVVVGGHSVRDAEIKYGLSVTGIVRPEHLITNQKARPGDALVLTKALGTGFITTANKAGRCPEETLAAACASMTQLNIPGRDAARELRANACDGCHGLRAGRACRRNGRRQRGDRRAGSRTGCRSCRGLNRWSRAATAHGPAGRTGNSPSRGCVSRGSRTRCESNSCSILRPPAGC